jgi:Fe-S-cluster containining protein
VIEANAKNVELLARRSEKDNWDFRAWLKIGCDLSEKQIDRLVADATTKVWASFDCTTCANCCKKLGTNVSAEEIRQMAGALGISQQEFGQRYIDGEIGPEDFDNGSPPDQWLMRGDPCPMLKDNKCTVYDARPRECRKYPYLYKAEFTRRTMGMIERTFTCPIVYQVMEELKARLPQWREMPAINWDGL